MKNFLETEEILKMVFELVVNFTNMLPRTKEFEEMNTMELYLFLYVALNGPKKMSELSDVLKTTKSNVTNLVDALERNGYLSRIRSKEDRRVIMVELTKEGEKLYRKLLDSFDSLIKKIVSKIPQEDLEEFSRGFLKMVSLFTENFQRGETS
jgi:DNA-binding MarR family transcriptional regulator